MTEVVSFRAISAKANTMTAVSAPPVRALRIVIVDDDAGVRALLRALLRTAGSDVVAEIDDGDGAAAAVLESEPDLVIVDYHMARVDGIDATRAIQAARPGTRIVAFTSSDDAAVANAFLGAGALRHFDKLRYEDLMRFVAELTASSVAAQLAGTANAAT